MKYQCLCGFAGAGEWRKSTGKISRKITYFHVVRHKMAYKMAYRNKKMAYKLYCKERGKIHSYVNHMTMDSALFFCSLKAIRMIIWREERAGFLLLFCYTLVVILIKENADK